MSSSEVSALNIAKRCALSADKSVTSRLSRFCVELGSIFGLNLRPCAGNSDSQIKEFCTGLLEGKKHPWDDSVRRLSSRGRFSVAFSLFLFRKLVPSREPQVEAYAMKMAEPQLPPDGKFLEFARRMTRSVCRKGWDRDYASYALTSTLPLSSCYERSRMEGGCRGRDHRERWNRETFVEEVLAGERAPERGVSKVRAVNTGDKWRIVTVPPVRTNVLRPLHKTIYGHLSRLPWLLRGDAVPNRFKDFTLVEDEIFVSGDYESATDNLNVEVQRVILRELLDSSCVPPGIQEEAMESLNCRMETSTFSAVQRRGQLMGNLLSFPLLCLTNFITFKYAVRRNVPLRINGDDIVFRATPEEASRWKGLVSSSGLVLSEGKTLESKKFFTLNSTPFEATKNRSRFVSFIRPRCIWKDVGGAKAIDSLDGRFRSFQRGFGFVRKSRLISFFLRENRGEILSTRRSVTRGLGWKVGRGALQDSNLWHRELFYLSKYDELPMPRMIYSGVRAGDVPQGWVRANARWCSPSDIKEWAIDFLSCMVEGAWNNDLLVGESEEKAYMTSVHAGCEPWSFSGIVTPRVVRLLGLSRTAARKLLLIRDSSCFGRVRFVRRGKEVWKPEVPLVDDTSNLVSAPVELKLKVGTVIEGNRFVQIRPGLPVRIFEGGFLGVGPPPTFDSTLY